MKSEKRIKPAKDGKSSKNHEKRAGDIAADSADSSLFLLDRLTIAAEGVARVLSRRLEAKFGLSLAEWRILAVLQETDSVPTAVVLSQTSMDRVKVSRAVMRLDDKKLIRRQTLRDDQRAQALELTEAGRTLYRSMLPMVEAIEMSFLEELSGKERRRLQEALPKIIFRAQTFEAKQDEPVKTANESRP